MKNDLGHCIRLLRVIEHLGYSNLQLGVHLGNYIYSGEFGVQKKKKKCIMKQFEKKDFLCEFLNNSLI